MIKNRISRGALVVVFFAFAFWGATVASAIENSDCMDCHGDSSLVRKDSQGGSDSLFVDLKGFQRSVHNINGIQCVDCHADIVSLDMDQDVPHSLTMALVNCGGCHEAETAGYQMGVHHQASSKGITIECYACHGYHDVVSTENQPVLERENKSCLKCHEPSKFHNWLPQKEVHFTYVQCTVCHAPDTAHQIHLRFYDLAKKKFLSAEDVLSALGTDIDGFMPTFNKGEAADGLSLEDFDNMVFALNRRGLHVNFHAELLSEREPLIHQVTKVSAKRTCEDCHAPSSKFFDSVALMFVSNDGSAHKVKVDRKVLESYNVGNFYMPGGSRVRLLDKIGLLAILGAGCGVTLHLLGRIVTAPMRKRRAHDSGEHKG